MAELPALTLDDLQRAVEGEAAAVRSVTRLQPAGGKGDKVFPPTYATDRGATTKYAFETRRVDGQDVVTVLLDSVASQANRMEEALLAAWEGRRIDIPVISVDFLGGGGDLRPRQDHHPAGAAPHSRCTTAGQRGCDRYALP